MWDALRLVRNASLKDLSSIPADGPFVLAVSGVSPGMIVESRSGRFVADKAGACLSCVSDGWANAQPGGAVSGVVLFSDRKAGKGPKVPAARAPCTYFDFTDDLDSNFVPVLPSVPLVPHGQCALRKSACRVSATTAALTLDLQPLLPADEQREGCVVLALRSGVEMSSPQGSGPGPTGISAGWTRRGPDPTAGNGGGVRAMVAGGPAGTRRTSLRRVTCRASTPESTSRATTSTETARSRGPSTTSKSRRNARGAPS
jgi:hypothetical protein